MATETDRPQTPVPRHLRYHARPQKSFADLLRILLAHIGLEKHLQSQFPGFASCAHAALAIGSQPNLKDSLISLQHTDFSNRNCLRIFVAEFLLFRVEIVRAGVFLVTNSRTRRTVAAFAFAEVPSSRELMAVFRGRHFHRGQCRFEAFVSPSSAPLDRLPVPKCRRLEHQKHAARRFPAPTVRCRASLH